jgi:hypothetical protein
MRNIHRKYGVTSKKIELILVPPPPPPVGTSDFVHFTSLESVQFIYNLKLLRQLKKHKGYITVIRVHAYTGLADGSRGFVVQYVSNFRIFML